MPSTYSNLKVQLMADGEDSGTWGGITNTNLGTTLEEAIVDSVDVVFSSADVTLTLTNTNNSQVARHLRLSLTGTSGGARNLILGSGCQINKPYIINNTLADAVTVKNTTGTGIAVPAGKTMWVYNNGTNVVDAVTHLSSLTLGAALPIASGGTGSTSTTFVNLATNVTGTLPVANGGTGITAFGTGVATALGQNVSGSGSIALTTSPVFTTPNLGTPSALTLTNATGLPLSTGVTGQLALANGGTGANLTDPNADRILFWDDSAGAVTWLEPGSGITISGTTISATSSGGTVTSVGGTGTVNGITLTGTVTSSGNLTLGGSLTGVDLSTQVTGTLPVTNGGTGLATVAQGDLIYASASNTLVALPKNTTATRYLANTGTSNNPAWAQIDLSNGVTGDLPFANLTQGSALSVLGVTGNSTADFASIAASNDNAVLRRSGTSLAFGAVNLASSNAVTGALPIANGGNGLTSTPSNGQIDIGNGSGFTRTTLTAGSGISITNGSGSITITALSGGGGTVTSVSGTGTVNGLTLTGTVTTSGSLTLGGTLSNVSLTSAVTGTLPVANGGTGITSFGTGVATALGQNVSGSGSIALTTSPSFTTPVLGTPTSGTLSNCTVDGTDAVGFRNTPVNSRSSAYTLVLADSGKTILHPISDNNSRTFTIPANSSVAYPVGTVVTFINLINTVTIAITSDTMYLAGTGSTGSRTLAAYGVASAVKVASTTWVISGNGLT